MREIKFRLWDKERKEMINVGRIDIADGSCAPTIFGNVFYDYWNDVELMQYTGLKDKDGVEIYEGDIVETEDYYVGDRLMVKGTKQIIDDIRFCGKLLPCKVIGNVYENPELVEYE